MWLICNVSEEVLINWFIFSTCKTFSLDSSHCGGGWTLYSLSLPSPPVLYNDILCVASAHQWSSPTTYRHLLCEGHVILRTALTTATWMPGSSEAFARSYDDEFTNTLQELYRDSCALLADYYIMWVEHCWWIGCTLWTGVICRWLPLVNVVIMTWNILTGWVHINCLVWVCLYLVG
jgi:hypothetical protein